MLKHCCLSAEMKPHCVLHGLSRLLLETGHVS